MGKQHIIDTTVGWGTAISFAGVLDTFTFLAVSYLAPRHIEEPLWTGGGEVNELSFEGNAL